MIAFMQMVFKDWNDDEVNTLIYLSIKNKLAKYTWLMLKRFQYEQWWYVSSWCGY